MSDDAVDPRMWTFKRVDSDGKEVEEATVKVAHPTDQFIRRALERAFRQGFPATTASLEIDVENKSITVSLREPVKEDAVALLVDLRKRANSTGEIEAALLTRPAFVRLLETELGVSAECGGAQLRGGIDMCTPFTRTHPVYGTVCLHRTEDPQEDRPTCYHVRVRPDKPK